jgi:hypothetical protein
MQNQVTEEDRLRCFVDSKYSPQRTIRHLELRRTKNICWTQVYGFGWLFNMQGIDIGKALHLLNL